MSIVDHGIPVVSSRQWTTALSPNAAGDGWNYIVQTGIGETNPYQFTVLKDLTGVHGAPTVQNYDGLSGIYANTLFALGTDHGQIRAANGRIFFPEYKLYLSYYDPTTEQVHQIGPLAESPPIDQNASTIFYSASFDVAGQLYFATQESHFRPSCIVQMDPTTLTQTILGYVGSGALAYTTYGYRIAPDTATATKYIYVAYGETPWQLWALNISTGATTKLYEVTSTGNIQFTNISGKGWVATIDTNLGQPGNVRTQWWCLDGALYAYTIGVDPPGGLARNVTPASNPLVSAPLIDTTSGAGTVGWRSSASDPFAYVTYPVNNSEPVAIESLVALSDGILGNAEQYNGFFRFEEPSDNHTWYGPFAGISEGPRLNVGGIVYMAGYPNGVLYRYDPTSAWAPSATTPNPKNLGNYGLHGTEFSGIKYANFLAWSSSKNRLYCAGSRERNGVGSGIGYFDTVGQSFAGTYASPLDTVLPQGLVAMEGISRIVMSSSTLSGDGTAPLYVFDQNLVLQATQLPIDGQSALGPIFTTGSTGILAGVFIKNGFLNLYRWNVTTGQLEVSFETDYGPAISASTVNTADGALWIAVGDTLVGINPDTLELKTIDISSISPVSCLAVFGADMYMSSGGTLYSAAIPSTFSIPFIDPDVLFPSGIIGRALGPPDFFDLLISTLNELGEHFSIATLDQNILRATAEVGKAQGIPDFFNTIVSTVNSCAVAMSQPTMDTNILKPSSKTGEAFSVPDFYQAVIFKVNDLINHL